MVRKTTPGIGPWGILSLIGLVALGVYISQWADQDAHDVSGTQSAGHEVAVGTFLVLFVIFILSLLGIFVSYWRNK